MNDTEFKKAFESIETQAASATVDIDAELQIRATLLLARVVRDAGDQIVHALYTAE